MDVRERCTVLAYLLSKRVTRIVVQRGEAPPLGPTLLCEREGTGA